MLRDLPDALLENYEKPNLSNSRPEAEIRISRLSLQVIRRQAGGGCGRMVDRLELVEVKRSDMSIATIPDQVDYPESDGKPMGETDLHRDWMIRILDILRHRYRDQRVYVASDLLVYYEEGRPTKFIVPDDFVVLDCEPGQRRIFRTWVEERTPDVVFEVTSRGTSSDDIVTKPPIYERIGVKEYFLYDPTGSYLTPALQGYRLLDGSFVAISEENGRLRCEMLGIDLRLDGRALRMTDAETDESLLTEAQSERQAKEVERQATEAERQAKEVERAGRQAAEARVRELLDEVERLKRGKSL